jgi:phage terminase large subunit-like protein
MKSQDLLQALLASDNPDDLELAESLMESAYLQFVPRPDNKDEGDEMTSFLEDEVEGIKCLLAGNAAGKTYTACWLFVREMLRHKPPQSNTPVWVISQTLEMCGTLYAQVLSRLIPKELLAKANIRWHKAGLHPESIMLPKDSRGNNWIIEFHSYDMGRKGLQASNVFAVLMDEQAPQSIIEEVIARLRTWWHPNCCIYSLTPLTPDPYLQEVYEHREDPEISQLWHFYRLNTMCNPHISEGWKKAFLDSLSPEQRATRQYGQFAQFAGMVYKEFLDAHCINPFDIQDARHILLGVDFGWRFSAAVLVAKINQKYIAYDELQMSEKMTEEFIATIRRKGFDYRVRAYADWADPQGMQRFNLSGIHVSPARKAKEDGIEALRSFFFQDRILIFKTCKRLIQHLKNYIWEPVKEGKAAKQETTNINTHLPDGLRYAIYSDLKSDVKPWPQLPSRSIRPTGGGAGIPHILRPGVRQFDFRNRR